MVLERVTCHIQLIRIFHARHAKSLLACLPLAPWRPSRYVYLLPLNDSSSSSSPQLSILVQQQSTSFGLEAFVRARYILQLCLPAKCIYSCIFSTLSILNFKIIFYKYFHLSNLFSVQLFYYQESCKILIIYFNYKQFFYTLQEYSPFFKCCYYTQQFLIVNVIV